jgi:hypothetical protein
MEHIDKSNMKVGRTLGERYTLEAWSYNSDSMLMGNIWNDTFDNLVVNEGLDDSLDKHLKGSGYTAAHYVLLMAATPMRDQQQRGALCLLKV